MSDTPRTDANEVESSDFSDWVSGPSGYVYTDFARTLERELSAAQARIAELEAENSRLRKGLEDEGPPEQERDTVNVPRQKP